jgi:hypothetical protein
MSTDFNNSDFNNSDSKDYASNGGMGAGRDEKLSAGETPAVTPEVISEFIPGAHAAAAAPAVALDPRFTGGKTPPQVESQEVVKEKRRYVRFKCDGSLELKTQGGRIQTWATFLDISAAGCYVEIATTFPVGTVLQARLGMHGFLVNTQAVVRVTYPFLGMGIEFTDMPEDDRKQFDAMLTSIAGAYAKRLQVPEPKPLGLPPITEPGAIVDALIEFFQEKRSMSTDDFVRLVKDSQQRST